MQTEDGITNGIRADLRALRISRLNFQIGRQQLISLIRQVDEAQISLRTATDNGNDSSPTQDLLNALSNLLAAKNGLISNRINHEIARINLFVDLELLYLDEQGIWLNRDSDPAEFANSDLTNADSTQISGSPELPGILPSDSTADGDSDDEAPQPDFEPTDGPSLEGPELDVPDVNQTPSDAGLNLEQSQLKIKSSRLGSRRQPAG